MIGERGHTDAEDLAVLAVSEFGLMFRADSLVDSGRLGGILVFTLAANHRVSWWASWPAAGRLYDLHGDAGLDPAAERRHEPMGGGGSVLPEERTVIAIRQTASAAVSAARVELPAIARSEAAVAETGCSSRVAAAGIAVDGPIPDRVPAAACEVSAHRAAPEAAAPVSTPAPVPTILPPDADPVGVLDYLVLGRRHARRLRLHRLIQAILRCVVVEISG